MKKALMITGLVMVTVLFILVLGRLGYYETHYEKFGTVTKIEDEKVFVKDNDNEVWSFYGNGFRVGQNLKMEMFTNETDLEVLDDEIVKVVALN